MYDDYIQNFSTYPYSNDLAYPDIYDYSVENPLYNYYRYSIYNRNMDNNINVEEFYPETYRTIYPIVKKVCTNILAPVTKEDFENMVTEVVNNKEIREFLDEDTINKEFNRSSGIKKEEENRGGPRNNLISDIVRILLIRELLNKKPCRWPNCKPEFGMPPPPFRPPYPRYN